MSTDVIATGAVGHDGTRDGVLNAAKGANGFIGSGGLGEVVNCGAPCPGGDGREIAADVEDVLALSDGADGADGLPEVGLRERRVGPEASAVARGALARVTAEAHQAPAKCEAAVAKLPDHCGRRAVAAGRQVRGRCGRAVEVGAEVPIANEAQGVVDGHRAAVHKDVGRRRVGIAEGELWRWRTRTHNLSDLGVGASKAVGLEGAHGHSEVGASDSGTAAVVDLPELLALKCCAKGLNCELETVRRYGGATGAIAVFGDDTQGLLTHGAVDGIHVALKCSNGEDAVSDLTLKLGEEQGALRGRCCRDEDVLGHGLLTGS